MEPRRITPLQKTPLNRLFFAINHYVSTGDHFGEGIGVPESDPAFGLVRVLIPVNRHMAQDQADFRCLQSKFDELAAAGEFPVRLEHMGTEGLFDYWSFVVPTFRMDALADELRRAPGPAGWGSGKAIIDQHKWRER